MLEGEKVSILGFGGGNTEGVVSQSEAPPQYFALKSGFGWGAAFFDVNLSVSLFPHWVYPNRIFVFLRSQVLTRHRNLR